MCEEGRDGCAGGFEVLHCVVRMARCAAGFKEGATGDGDVVMMRFLVLLSSRWMVSSGGWVGYEIPYRG